MNLVYGLHVSDRVYKVMGLTPDSQLFLLL